MKQMISLTVAMFLLLPGYLFAQEQVDAPKFKNGDYWHFNLTSAMAFSSSGFRPGMYEKLFNDGNFRFFKLEQNEKTPVDNSLTITISILQAMHGRGTYLGGKYLEFPLSVGQKWNVESTVRLPGLTRDITFKGETKVVGSESVSTPAGNFRALKLIRQLRDSTGSDTTITYYYSPETKSLVKFLLDSSDGTRNVELVKFGAAQ